MQRLLKQYFLTSAIFCMLLNWQPATLQNYLLLFHLNIKVKCCYIKICGSISCLLTGSIHGCTHSQFPYYLRKDQGAGTYKVFLYLWHSQMVRHWISTCIQCVTMSLSKYYKVQHFCLPLHCIPQDKTIKISHLLDLFLFILS